MQVFVRDSNILKALRTLKKKLEKEGVPGELRKRDHFEKPSVRRRAKHRRAVTRARKHAAKFA